MYDRQTDKNTPKSKVQRPVTNLTAHDVAMHMLIKENTEPTQNKRKRKQTTHEIPQNVSNDQKHRSCHGSLLKDFSSNGQEEKDPSIKLPVIKPTEHSKRRSSIADPQEVSHIIRRRLAWQEKSNSNSEEIHRENTKRTIKSVVGKTSSKVIRKTSKHGPTNKPSPTRRDSGIPQLNSQKNCQRSLPMASTPSIYIPHDSQPDAGNRRQSIDKASLQHYYDLLAESERQLKEQDKDFETPPDSHCPISTLKRSNRRKVMALEALLMQLPSYKNNEPEMDPLECLNCSYLRLSKQNVEDLERECLLAGKDPGAHVHMSEDRVNEYFKDS